jgi:hypothetical protein
MWESFHNLKDGIYAEGAKEKKNILTLSTATPKVAHLSPMLPNDENKKFPSIIFFINDE